MKSTVGAMTMSLQKALKRLYMRFDMRPMLFADRLELTALTLLAGDPKLEEMIRNLATSEKRRSTITPQNRPAPGVKAYLLFGAVIALLIISAVALGRVMHSFLVGIVAFFASLAILKRLAEKVFYSA